MTHALDPERIGELLSLLQARVSDALAHGDAVKCRPLRLRAHRSRRLSDGEPVWRGVMARPMNIKRNRRIP
jgi:hypothetical protein